MSFRRPHMILEQSMHRLLDRFEYISRNDVTYNINLEDCCGHIQLDGVAQNDLQECQTVMSDGFDTIDIVLEIQDDGSYTVTAHYTELPQ